MFDHPPSPAKRRSLRTRALRIAIAASTCVAFAAATTALALTWGAPADVAATSGNSGQQIAIAPDGAVTAVWSHFGGTSTIIQAASRPAGSNTWGTASDLSATGQSADSPQIAVASDGSATAVWIRYDGANNIIQAATRPAGGSWSAPSDLSVTGQSAFSPQIAMASDGSATAVWSRFNGAKYIIQAATRPAGGSWGAPTDLSATGQNAGTPHIAIASDGSASAVWRRSNGANYIVQAASRPAGGSWGAATDLSAPGQNADIDPQIAMASDGSATAVWSRSNGANSIIQAATRPAGGSWGAPTDLSATGQSAFYPEIAVASDGSATAVWRRSNGANNIVQAATRPAGGSWGAPTDLSAAGRNADAPQVAVGSDGAATAVWNRSNGTNSVIQAATRPGGGSWGAPADVSGPGDAEDAQIAVAPDGTAAVIWDEWNSGFIQATVSAAPNATLTVATTGTGTGLVASSPAGISCGATCSASFALSSTVTLTATPAGGSTFAGWSGDCSGASTTCTVTILGAASATATFTAAGPTPSGGSSNGTSPAAAPSNASSSESSPSTTPSNVLRVASAKPGRASVITRISVPGPGTITQRGTYGASSTARELATRTACSVSRRVRAAGTVTVTCTLNAAARRARTTGPLRLRVATTFTPTGGTARTTTRTVTFRALRPKPAVTG